MPPCSDCIACIACIACESVACDRLSDSSSSHNTSRKGEAPCDASCDAN